MAELHEIKERPAQRPSGLARCIRLALGLGLLACFFGFLTTRPLPPGMAGAIIERNLQQDVQATALFYSDLNAMAEIEARLRPWPHDQCRTPRSH